MAAYLRNNKDLETGLLLSQSLSFKAYKTYIAAIYFQTIRCSFINKNKNIRCLFKATAGADAADKGKISGVFKRRRARHLPRAHSFWGPP